MRKRDREFKRMSDIINEKTKYGKTPISERKGTTEVGTRSADLPRAEKKSPKASK